MLNVVNCPSAANAEQEIYHQFKSEGLGDVGFSHGTAQALWNSILSYSDGSTPSNLSAFAFFQQMPLQRDSIQTRALTLTMINQIGMGATVDEISKSARQTVSLPETFDQLHRQIKFLRVAFKIVTGEASSATGELSRLVDQIESVRHNINAKLVNDKFVCAKILLAIDRRLQIHIEDCSNAGDRTEVDVDVLNFGRVLADIKLGTFQMDLPPSFKDLSNSPKDDDDTNGQPNQRGGKRGKKRDNDGNSRDERKDVNSKPVDGICLLPNENFTRIFGGKHLDARPSWGDKKKMCVRFHIAHTCYRNCNQKDSHVPASEVPPEKVEEMKAYMKKCRADA